jgi:TRAP-type C4-dicarboxylate transport system substrate-binding protein
MKFAPRALIPAALLLALLAPRPTASQAPVTIKLASLVPDGSVWHKVLLGMGAQWSQTTQGRVALRVYPGGVAGDEPDMVRKMRIGQLQAAALTVVGLSAIDEAFKVFEIPMFFDSYGELLTVLDRMEPTLRQRLDARGFVMLNWGHAGWVHMFTRKPATSVDDLKRLKMYVWAGDDRMVSMWKENGFQPVPLAMTDIVTGLQTGMFDALPTTPLAALSLQWFRTTPNMGEIGIAPLVGALVVTKQAWSRISDADRVALLTACKKAEAQLEMQIPGQDSLAVVEMEKRGLTLIRATPAAAAEWRATSDQFAAKMRATMVPAEIFDLAFRERDAYRKRH